MTDSSTKADVWLWLAFGLCVVVAVAGGFAGGCGQSPLWTVPVIVISTLVGGGVAARMNPRAGAGWTIGAAVAIVLVGSGGGKIGRVWLRHALRSEVERIQPLIKEGQVLGFWDVPNPGILRRAFIRNDPRGNGLVAVLPLDDGSAINYFSNQQYWERESKSRCSEEIAPGWYRRFRCD